MAGIREEESHTAVAVAVAPVAEPTALEPSKPKEEAKWYRSLPLFVPGDIDAFAGLFSNNLATMLAGAQMLATILPSEIIFGRIIPGVGLSMLVGCIYYVLQALLTASKTGQHKLCCLPFGINTPGVFAFNSGIIFAVYYAEGGGDQAAELAWQVGVAANFVQGVVNISLSPFGSPWGMTVFIGHGAFKAMGAQVGYSLITGVAFIIVCFSGFSSVVLAVFPAEVLNPIILYVGLVVCVEALDITPPRHWPAFLVALVPGFFNWAQQVASDFAAAICERGFLINGNVVEAGANAACAVSGRSNEAWTLSPTLAAVRAFGKGYILTSIVWAAMVVYIADRKFGMAAVWSFIAAALSSVGLIHAEVVYLPWEPEGDESFHWEIVGGYLLTAACLLFTELAMRFKKQPEEKESNGVELDDMSSGNPSMTDNSERV